MTGTEYLLSTAYMPPAGYFAVMMQAERVFIERHENYVKQSYRNRCIIMATNGIHSLTVPVLRGSFHKVPLGETGIDYSRRWVSVHQRAIVSAYRNSPFFSFYADDLFGILDSCIPLLLDLNMKILNYFTMLLEIPAEILFTDSYVSQGNSPHDLRYSISPKGCENKGYDFVFPPYSQVFSDRHGFIPDLSIIDLLFNLGPETRNYLVEMTGREKNIPPGKGRIW